MIIRGCQPQWLAPSLFIRNLAILHQEIPTLVILARNDKCITTFKSMIPYLFIFLAGDYLTEATDDIALDGR